MAAAAGLSPALVTRHFGSKQGLREARPAWASSYRAARAHVRTQQHRHRGPEQMASKM
ncbi:TetR/AcrR family transcriptional regulator [Streptomyces sp. NBC_00006]|uniref:TetR family transcriptional regulator n=1 Tax=unclassified Streptomyces TaxID=2593676 RepID=UPI0022513092|nr:MULTISPECIES: TetR family transcriptional regulator [unclassified Streptomyces]MCX4834185.1 TetR/AcrR family transcriptional regulator [Streptomyces sp. NBC_01016]MCX5529904.1 TetR/AcrR family transcriptional regulator [Streptomyces sp. NBC_00006]